MARIMVVDDEAALRRAIRLMLEHAGHVVIEAANGREAEEKQRAEPVDLALVDIIMPEKEGIETIMALRRDYRALRIVAMSGGGRVRNLRFLDIAKDLGADAALAKPFRRDELLAAIDAQLVVKTKDTGAEGK